MIRDLTALDVLPDDAPIFGPEVALLCRCSRRTFYERRASRTFPVREVFPRIDRRPRFRVGDVRAYVRGQQQQSVNSTAA